MGDEKLNAVLKWASELATLQDNLGDRFDLVENTRGKFNLVPVQMTDNSNQRDISTLMEIVNANNGNEELLYAPRKTRELAILEKAVEDHLSGQAISKLATRGMRDPAKLPPSERMAGAKLQAGYLGTGRDALTGGPMSMLNFDAGHIKPNINNPSVAHDPKNIRPQAAAVNRAAREAQGTELIDRLLNGYRKRLRR